MYPRPQSCFNFFRGGAPLTYPLPAQISAVNRLKKFDWVSLSVVPFFDCPNSGDRVRAGTHLDDKVVVCLLPGGLAFAVPVGTFHSVGEHIGENALYIGGGGGGRGRGLATGRTH
jgi:hypothetical protein